jgi:hypothetical protein
VDDVQAFEGEVPFREPGHGFPDAESLPGRTRFGVRQEAVKAPDVEEEVQEPAVGDVGVPWLEFPDDERGDEGVQVVPDRVVGHAERAGAFGRVPGLAVIVSHHLPETIERWSGHADVELGHVALQERVHEVPSPAEAVVFGGRQEGEREASPEPEPVGEGD